MLFNHTDNPLEILVVGSFSFLLTQNWAPAKGLLRPMEGLCLPIGVGLALDLHDLILPQMGESVLHLALGHALG